MKVERVYIIRHGQTEWNATRRWQGFEDVPLNAQGFQQAEHLANYLCTTCAVPISQIFSSDLQRAVQTAAPLAKRLNIEIQTDPRFREVNIGIFQGLTADEIDLRYPAERAALEADKFNYILPGGESRRQLQARAYAAWQDLIVRANGSHVALISHGGTIKQLLLRLFSDEALADTHFGNTSITTIERRNHEWQLLGLAEIPHLNLPQHFDSSGIV